MTSLNSKLKEQIVKKQSRFCLGLDPNLDKIPEILKKHPDSLFEFNRRIIDATQDLICAYKPNMAFYLGENASRQLQLTCDYLKKNYPEILIFLDAKYADILDTNQHYANYAFDQLNADYVTLSPYVGKKGLMSFLNRKDKGAIVLCKSSNPGAEEIQDQKVNDKELYLNLAKNIEESWNENQNCMLVAGATYPESIKKIREAAPSIPFLIPGIGVQKGSLEESVKAGLDLDNSGIVLSTSRVVLYASSKDDFDIAAREATLKIRDDINSVI